MYVKLPILCVFFIICSQAAAQTNSDFIGGANIDGVTVTSSDPSSEAIRSINGDGLEEYIQIASRFLAHATLGATIEEIEEVSQVGIENWIDEQYAIPITNYTDPTVEILFELYERCKDKLGDECDDEFVPNPVMWRYAWWHNTMHGQDKLRQRVAMALSEILVVSDQSDLGNIPHGIAYYYDILMQNAFGNYKTMLTEMTLSPAMGFYLSHMNNPKSIPMLNIRPDENYAREFMQLFTIGLYELNQNGTRKINLSDGKWIPTYDNDDIKGLAKVFTGLSGAAWQDEDNNRPVAFGKNHFRYSFITPMKMYEEWHEEGEKRILGKTLIPSGQSGMEDIEQAIDHIFHHDNVGPFLAKRLIQRLVKSNPSAEYIERISTVFNNNGSGERGDLGAMIKSILTDQEAMDCYRIDHNSNGMLRTPMLRYTQMMLGLKAATKSEWFWNSSYFFQEQTEQHVLSSPTVFNFYTPDYVPDSDFAYNNMVGPEFQILNSSTSSNYINWMFLALNRDYLYDKFEFEFPDLLNETYFLRYTDDVESYKAAFSDEYWLGLASEPEHYVDYLDILLTNGQLSNDKKERLIKAMNRKDLFNTKEAADYALFMIMIDPDFVVMK